MLRSLCVFLWRSALLIWRVLTRRWLAVRVRLTIGIFDCLGSGASCRCFQGSYYLTGSAVSDGLPFGEAWLLELSLGC